MNRSRFFRRLVIAPLLAAGIGVVTAKDCSAQRHSDAELFDQHLLNGACRPCAVPPWAPELAAPSPSAPTPPDREIAPPAEEPPPVPGADQVFLPPAQGTLLAAASIAGTPSMIGDFFGPGRGTLVFEQCFTRIVGPRRPTALFGQRVVISSPSFPSVVGSTQQVVFTTQGLAFTHPGIPSDPSLFIVDPTNVTDLETFIRNRLGAEAAAYNPETAIARRLQVVTPETTSFPIENDPYQIEGDFDLFFVPRLVVECRELVFAIPTPSPGSVVGREKIADNTSPIPRDRVFFNYSYFDNVPLAPGGVNVNRFTPGFEKTFFDGLYSFEARFPFASTLDSNILVDGITNDNEIEFGNVVLYNKLLLYSGPTAAFSAGLGIALPTADDMTIGLLNVPGSVEIRNESVHLLPFVGGVWAPTTRFFVQGFLQADVDANGNPVSVNSFRSGTTGTGRLQDAAFLYADIGAGYWLYRNASPGARLTGIAPMVELHYNRSLESGDVLRSGPFAVGDFAEDIQIVNATIGTTLLLGNQSTLQVAYGAPIGNSTDHVFDGELRVNFNWYFGGAGGPFGPFGQAPPPF